MTKINSTVWVLLGVVALGAGHSRGATLGSKVFNYNGPLPIKDDRTGEIIHSNSSNETDSLEPATSGAQTADEAACWTMIVEQSAVTFALQNKVLDELQRDLASLNLLNSTVGERANSIANKMRANMEEALEALNVGSAEEYFDNLFDSSENIIQMSALVRDSKLDEQLFLVLVKAVSRLGRNNSALVQEFTDRCSIVERSPRPRAVTV